MLLVDGVLVHERGSEADADMEDMLRCTTKGFRMGDAGNFVFSGKLSAD